jgi:DNA repair protein RadD
LMQLREYQSRSIELLYDWMSNNIGHPCVVMPTGSGKSHVIAALCKDAIQTWPETRILMLTHVKELIEQNAEKMRLHWPGAPLGIYSASVGKRQLGEPITFAGIQSVRDKAKLIGHIDLIIIDECHLVNHKDEGGYRKLIGELIAVNPALRIIGYSATPYRLGHGLITDKPALFDDLLTPVSIEELVFKGYLATLRSKVTKAKLDVSGVKKRGGEFIESELQAAVDTDDKNQAVVHEVMGLAGERKAWLFFCAGVKHAEHVAEVLRHQGVTAECVTGETPKKERERMLVDFKAGRVRALTNANVLTTGFDYPDIDLVVMLRPTMSASLYVQMAGRGMRVKSHTDHCLVLDFAGVVESHGPITNVQPPKKGGDGNGEAPVKVCDHCGELVHISVMLCPSCGEQFPEPVKKSMVLRNDDIMGLDGQELDVTSWTWRKHISKASGIEMLAVTYYGGLSDTPITEYLPIMHEGYAGQRAMSQLLSIANSASIVPGGLNVKTLEDMVQNMNMATPPEWIEYRKDGKFFRVIKRSWE